MAQITFQMQVACDNSAFDDAMASELSAIMRKARKEVEAGADGGYCYDSNGNRVGEWSIRSKGLGS